MPAPSQQGLILTVIGMHNEAILQNQIALWDKVRSAFGACLSFA